MIFKDALAKNLEEYERCETDWGYRGSAPGLVKCPGGLLADPDPSVKAMSVRVRSRQETVNERFKNWEILNAPYRHNIFKHQIVSGAIVCLTQLSLRDNPLFSVRIEKRFKRWCLSVSVGVCRCLSVSVSASACTVNSTYVAILSVGVCRCRQRRVP